MALNIQLGCLRVIMDHDWTGVLVRSSSRRRCLKLAFPNVVLLFRRKIIWKAKAKAVGCELKFAPPGTLNLPRDYTDAHSFLATG